MKSHLKLVQYVSPITGSARVCAAIWKQDHLVRLASPLLRVCHGAVDPLPFIRQFGDALPALDAFETTMQWLDAACFAATDPREVQQACEANPEWHLRCLRYDGGDEALLGISALIHSVKCSHWLPLAILLPGLLEVLRRIVDSHPALHGASIGNPPHDTGDLALIELTSGQVIRVVVAPQPLKADEELSAWLGALAGQSDQPRPAPMLVISPSWPSLQPSRIKEGCVCSPDMSAIRSALLAVVGPDPASIP